MLKCFAAILSHAAKSIFFLFLKSIITWVGLKVCKVLFAAREVVRKAVPLGLDKQFTADRTSPPPTATAPRLSRPGRILAGKLLKQQ